MSRRFVRPVRKHGLTVLEWVIAIALIIFVSCIGAEIAVSILAWD